MELIDLHPQNPSAYSRGVYRVFFCKIFDAPHSVGANRIEAAQRKCHFPYEILCTKHVCTISEKKMPENVVTADPTGPETCVFPEMSLNLNFRWDDDHLETIISTKFSVYVKGQQLFLSFGTIYWTWCFSTTSYRPEKAKFSWNSSQLNILMAGLWNELALFTKFQLSWKGKLSVLSFPAIYWVSGCPWHSKRP